MFITELLIFSLQALFFCVVSSQFLATPSFQLLNPELWSTTISHDECAPYIICSFPYPPKVYLKLAVRVNLFKAPCWLIVSLRIKTRKKVHKDLHELPVICRCPFTHLMVFLQLTWWLRW